MDILLVDDETAFAGLLADRLRLRGYTVRCAPNAETALRLIGEKAPDVAFLDVGLPGMDGIGLLEKIRLMPAPVICCMLTGAAQVSVAARALRSGAFDWLAKPVTLEAVEKVLSRAREHQKKARQQEILAEAARSRPEQEVYVTMGEKSVTFLVDEHDTWVDRWQSLWQEKHGEGCISCRDLGYAVSVTCAIARGEAAP